MLSFVRRFKRAQPALGTLIEISVETEDEALAHSTMTLAFAEIRRLERIFNRFDSESELSQIHENARSRDIQISSELAFVLDLGLELETKYRESFRLMPDCTHEKPCYELGPHSVKLTGSCSFDLGGIAKGYIVDQAHDLIQKIFPSSPFLINAGGDLRGSGSHVVEVRIPGRIAEQRYSITLHNGALATSSLLGEMTQVGRASARFSSEFWRSQTASAAVVAPSCAYADAFTKVALFSDAQPEAPVQVYRFNELGEMAS